MSGAGHYRDRRVLVTGGLGFLGSNLVLALAGAGAHVTVVDNLDPLYGGNRFNIETAPPDVRVVIGDVRDEALLRPLVEESELIFHLAAQVSYIDSLAIPLEDLDLNAGATLRLLELCRHHNPTARVLLASSRMVLGRVSGGRFDEEAVARPLSLYGIHKLASEQYLRVYHEAFGIPCLALRITNPFGPRQQIKHDKYALVGWFVRQALEDRTIRIFDAGEQLRDYIYVDDIVEAFLRCAALETAAGEAINVGTGQGTSFREMVHTVLDVVGRGRVEHVPWPKDYERIETGDVVADVTRLERLTGWAPEVSLAEGVRRTCEYYREHLSRYV